MKFTIIGCGNAALIHSAKLCEKGYDVAILKTSNYNNTFYDIIKKEGGYNVKDETHGGKRFFVRPALITKDVKEAIEFGDVLMVMTTTSQQEYVAELIAPHVRDGQIIALIPGNLGSLIFKKYINKNIVYSEWETTAYNGRIVDSMYVRITFYNPRNAISVLPLSKSSEVLSIFSECFDNTKYLRRNIVESALHNPNTIVHTIGLLFSVSRIEHSQGEFWMYKEGFTPSVIKVINSLDIEKNKILNAFGCESLNYFDAAKWRNSEDLTLDAMEVFNSFAESSNKGPSFVNHRYFTEDVPIGLGLLTSLGEVVGADMSIPKSIMTLASVLIGKDFNKEARTIQKLIGKDSVSVEDVKEAIGITSSMSCDGFINAVGGVNSLVYSKLYRVGILRESKQPIDNRVVLTPSHIKKLKQMYPNAVFKVQPSPIRAFSDEEYTKEGIMLCDDLSDCDLLLGVKEIDVSAIIPGKHYVFFGHIAKRQEYNKPLFKKLLSLNTTFSDHEYFTDNEGKRLVAFGWFAGVVGVYYTLMGWGLKTGLYNLPAPHINFSIEELISNIREANPKGIKIIVTGKGRVSTGAQYVLEKIGAKEIAPEQFLVSEPKNDIIYTVLSIEKMIAHNDLSRNFDREDFRINPHDYHSIFLPYAMSGDILIAAHYWEPGQPIYLTEENLADSSLKIRMIGDITCDIKGGIMSTVRAATHCAPFYDYNPKTGKEETAFSSENNITVMAVDTCPNAIPREASEYFGDNFINYILTEFLESEEQVSQIVKRATIINNGNLTEEFSYLNDYILLFN